MCYRDPLARDIILPWVLQASLLLKKGSQHSKSGGGHSKHYGVVIHYPVVFLVAGSFGKCGICLKSPRVIRASFSTMLYHQGRKRSPNLNFLVRIFSGGVGVFHVKGWGPKSSVWPSKPGRSNFLGGISRDFAGISRKRPKSLRKKVCVQFSFRISAVCKLWALDKWRTLASSPSLLVLCLVFCATLSLFISFHLSLSVLSL